MGMDAWCPLARIGRGIRVGFALAVVPMLAGAGRMPQRKYATANAIGAAIWAVGISLLGFWLGKSIDIDKYIYPIVGVIIALSLIPPFLEYRRHRRAQASGT